MIGIDTNVLIRFLTRDDPELSPRAMRILKERTPEDPAFISSIVLAEVFWVLRSAFKYSREQICKAFDTLLHLEEIEFEHVHAVQYAFHLYRTGRADFADALLGRIAKEYGCQTTYTFDKGAAALVDFTEGW